jgi:hypothetical protein
MTDSKQRPARDKQAIRLLGSALEEFARDGAVTSVRCDVCGSLIEIKTIGDEVYSASCNCGKFRDTLRGI